MYLSRNFLWFVALAVILSSTGCRLMQPPDECSHIDNSIANTTAQVDLANNIGHVRSCYDGIEGLESIGDLSMEGLLDGQSVALELDECCCIAAVNATLADVVDKERKASCCTIGYNGCLDQFLAGTALHLRNKAAGTAGELFLRLVEVHLQKDLVLQTLARLSEFREASQFAADQGLATDQADKELDANEIELKRKLLTIEQNQLQITVNLSALLGIERGSLNIIQPIFDLHPVYENVNVEFEIQTAFSTRPDLDSFSDGCGGVDPECFELLAQLSPAIGIGIVSKIKKAILLNRISDKQKCAAPTRRQQLQKIKSARQDLVRTQVTSAVIDIESGYRKLILENEDLQRLEMRMQALESAAEINPIETFVESVKNWMQQQSVRSQRITTAVDFEIAKIKLITSTGRWNEICGIPGLSSSKCDCCTN